MNIQTTKQSKSSAPQPEQRLNIAIQKSGRLADHSIDLLKRCGLKFTQSKDQLFWLGRNLPIDLIRVRDDDIPRLLMDGVCDIGIAGQNIALECTLERTTNGQSAEVEALRFLDFGHCRFSIAIPEDHDYQSCQSLQGKRIACSYPFSLKNWLGEQNIQADVVHLSGSVEIAPKMGTVDAIADLVSTGNTLKANHLKEAEVIFESQAALMRTGRRCGHEKEALIARLLQRLDGVQLARESKYVMLHAPKNKLDMIASLLPGAESPTIIPLPNSDDMVAIHAVCKETVFWEHLEELKTAGASAILVLPVEKMLA